MVFTDSSPYESRQPAFRGRSIGADSIRRRRAGRGLGPAFGAALLALPLTLAAAMGVARADQLTPPIIAALPPAAGSHGPTADLPKPLEDVDTDRYVQIFALQEKGNWAAADRLISQLGDTRLMGHVLAQRYLHPTAYRSKYKELAEWMAKYADHPEAPRIHSLALKRKPADAAAPKEPNVPTFHKVGSPDPAWGDQGPHWQAGLDAWRKGDMARAAKEFEKTATAEDSTPWTISGAAYWAGRAHLKARHPEKVSQWLKVAAEHPRTFYGQLARRALGMESAFDWAVRPLTETEANQLETSKTGARALALLQVGKLRLAEDEMQALLAEAGPDLAGALVSVSQLANLPSLALKLGTMIESQYGTTIATALYPVPGWQPSDGFEVDRALLYALMRQESGFNPDARSGVGASGLMQIMPATGAYISPELEDYDGGAGAALLDPTTNVTVGQDYVERLLADSNVRGDLFLLTAAYNAGPGNLAKWRKGAGYDQDPLLFIESIPSRETRLFIERVLANLWIYRQRLGQATPSLDAIASGAWPVYDRQENAANEIPRYVAN
jgi:soluble lytic murein transglycosylase-like protein